MYKQYYDVGEKILKQLNSKLNQEELTIEEIEEIIEAFGDAASRAKMVEFDLVEVHGGHGYLVNNFLSPRYNRRTDFFGASL